MTHPVKHHEPCPSLSVAVEPPDPDPAQVSRDGASRGDPHGNDSQVPGLERQIQDLEAGLAELKANQGSKQAKNDLKNKINKIRKNIDRLKKGETHGRRGFQN